MNERWTRAMLKANAKKLFKKNYWVCVAAAFVLALLGNGNLGGPANTGVRYSYEMRYDDNSYYGSYNNGFYRNDHYSESHFENDTAQIIFMTVFIVIFLIVFALMILLGILVFNVIEVGGKMFFIQNRSSTPSVGVVFDGFEKGRYGNIMKTMFFRNLFVFLWSLLLIVPGIIKGYEYLMVPYILAENPTMDRREVFALSKRMMDGQKWDAFVLSLSFFGWLLLSGITCGLVGIFYVNPYYMATFTELYAFNKIKAYNEGYIR